MKNKVIYTFCLLSLTLSSCGQAAWVQKPQESQASSKGTFLVPNHRLELRAAVVKNSGDLVPVARTEFTLTPYSSKEIRETIRKQNNPGTEPSYSDAEFKKDCTYGFCSTDFDAYRKALEAWQKKADQGYDEALEKAKKEAGRESVSVKTDLSGEASLELAAGKWYITGTYSMNSGKSKIYWLDIPIDVDSDTDKIELSNDNGDVLNLSS